MPATIVATLIARSEGADEPVTLQGDVVRLVPLALGAKVKTWPDSQGFSVSGG
jgi:hypothetical protein